ncbi:MAG: hypothetical protein L6Q99_09675 [Planctomycetes bacterium]|nr:hypothetical protein [Planctomycetota bacterium]
MTQRAKPAFLEPRWIAGALPALALSLSTHVAAQDPAPEAPQPFIGAWCNLLDNHSFGEVSDAEGELAARIPWWKVVSGEPRIVEWHADPTHPWGVLETPKGAVVRQPVAAYAAALRESLLPSALESATFDVKGRLEGPGVVTLIDGSGGRARVPVRATDTGEFEIELAEFEAALGRAAVPRFEIELSNDDSDVPARWSLVLARTPLIEYAGELRRVLHDELDWIFSLWLERCLDREGPRETSFTCRMLDVVTGATLVTVEAVGQPQPLYELMLDAWAVDHDPQWGAALERYVEELLSIGVHPVTGIPRQWDCVRDVPLDRNALEIGKAFHFLIDLAEKGPERFRERALAASKKLGETVLAKGVLPDGSIAPIYVPEDASPRTDAAPLRRLDVAAELARLAKLTGERRFTEAAERALAEFEFTNHWPGTWDRIDPGFDDSFGHYGARAVTMLEAFPDDPVFRRVVASGWQVYGPLWRDAIRFGGSMAADQVRCWDLLERYTRLEPSARDEFRRTLIGAVSAHFKGEQYGNGAWGDVTYFDFDPKVGLSVGDLPGAPANLLWGLGIANRRELALGDPELGSAAGIGGSIEAMFTAVFLSTREAYKRPFGYLSTQRERSGANPGAGELRVARGLIEMFATL